MYRTLPYCALFVVLVLLQVYFFNNLMLSVYLNPLIYIAFIALLPLNTPPIGVLLSGLALGVTMDWTMGTAGINTIATLFVAFLRPAMLVLFCGRENVREGGVPSAFRLGRRPFLNYLLLLVFLHHLLFFALESLSATQILYMLLRLVVSGSVSLLFIWYAAQIFTSKFVVRHG